jgi:hypothetical protein
VKKGFSVSVELQSQELLPEPTPETAVEAPPDEAHNTEEGHEFPRGAVGFVLVMITGYALYWLMIYLQILGHGR